MLRKSTRRPGVLPARVNQLTEWGEWDAVAQIFEELGLDVRRMGTDLAFQRALFLAHVGRVSEAIPIMEQVRLLEPLLDHPINVMGYLYLFAGRPAEAIAEFEQLWRGGDSVPRFTAMTGLGLALSARSEESIPVWLDRVRQVGELPEIEGFAEAMSRARDEPEAASAWLRALSAASRSSSHQGSARISSPSCRAPAQSWLRSMIRRRRSRAGWRPLRQ